MSQSYRPFGAVAPSHTDNAYILSLVPTVQDGLAAITSANELVVINRKHLAQSAVQFSDVPAATSCLVAGDAQGQLLRCSGGDGTVATFDVRTGSRTSAFRLDRAVTALECHGHAILLGTEFKSQQAIVSLWDARQNKQIWKNSENNDEITTVAFNPTRDDIVLSGGDDGLVSLFDTRIVEEEDSLLQVVNHGPIHKAGFLGDERVFALSSDQNLAIHPVSSPDDEADPQPTIFGDLRPLTSCQYVIDVLGSGEGYVIATGTNIDASRIDLVELRNAKNILAKPEISPGARHTIEPAHGEEIVRAIYIDDETQVIYTAGEDGCIRASRSSDSDGTYTQAARTPKSKKGSDVRYRPY